MKKKLLLIVNPCSGQKKGIKLLTDILELFYERDYSIQLHTTEKRHDATDFAHRFGGDADLIVCVGGDGTFNEVVGGMMEGKISTPIGYIPLGSTNDFASSLHIPKNWKKAALATIDGVPHSIDLGKFNERYFSYVASCGAFAKTSYSTPQKAKNVLGHLAYILEGMKDLSTLRPIWLRVRANGMTYEGQYIFVAFSNSTSLGGVLKLDPKLVDVNDGMMEILLIPYPSNAAQWTNVLNCLQKKKYDSPYINFLSTNHAEVETDGSFDWSLDGEQYLGCKGIDIEIQHNAITLIMCCATIHR